MIALVAAGYLGWVTLDQQVHQARLARELHESSRTGATSPTAVAPSATSLPVVAALAPAPVAAIFLPTPRPRPAPGALIGRLEIPRVGVSSFVAAGTKSLTMRRGVGHIDGTALPGEPGNVGLAGHRDTVLRGLRKIRTEDRILLTTPDGSFEYAVESLRTVGPAQVEVLEPSPYPTLTIVTCYPFDFIGPAPMRFIVRAREVGRTVLAPPAPAAGTSQGALSGSGARTAPASGS